jgi:poly(glycerol-phosphate) alpha-glucosyltransferase
MTLREVVHLPVNGLALRRGGLVKAVRLRANALAASGAREVVIEVLGFQSRLEEDVADLVDRGFLHPRVHVRNILRCLDPAAPGPTTTDAVMGCVHHGVPFGRARHMERSIRRRRVKQEPTRDSAGRALHLDSHGRRGNLLRRAEYGSGDRIVRILDYTTGDATPSAHRWIGRDGRCFLTVRPAEGGHDWGTASTAVAGFQTLPDPAALYQLAFEHAMRDEVNPVLFSEFREGLPNIPGRGFDAIALAVSHPTLRRIAVVHSNHAIQGQRQLPLQSDANFTALLEGLANWDLLVTATEHQRDDIVAQYGSAERVAVIAHHGPRPPATTDAEYDPNRFVLVARIHHKKRVDEAIEAFRLVVNELSDATLDVYGFGYGDELESQIYELVDHLGLGGHVTFRGFVPDIRSIYTGACASLQTSESEGFGMALLESLAYGVPVVAYNVSYGARVVIRDAVDGYVVPWGDRNGLARHLISLSTDPALRARLAAAGPVGASRFSRKRYVQEWGQALNRLPTGAQTVG